MNSFKTLTGKWKGTYILGPEYESDEGKLFDFILDLIDEERTFNGVCYEPEISQLFQKPITVTGFWDEDIISFTKKYPCLFFFDEDGKFVLDTTKEQPEIFYSGEFDETENGFSGDFEMVIDSFNYGEGWLEDSLKGTWIIKRIEES
jgi:hypothetical protein